jgi:hypothetical protein
VIRNINLSTTDQLPNPLQSVAHRFLKPFED